MLGEQVGLGVKSRLCKASWGFILSVMGSFISLGHLRSKCQEVIKEVRFVEGDACDGYRREGAGGETL